MALRVTQTFVEVVRAQADTPTPRVTQQFLEVIRAQADTPTPRVTQQFLEVIRSTNIQLPPPPSDTRGKSGKTPPGQAKKGDGEKQVTGSPSPRNVPLFAARFQNAIRARSAPVSPVPFRRDYSLLVR